MMIRDSKPMLQNTDIEELEVRLGFKLTDEYKGFLLQYNGGIPTPNVFDFIDNDGQKSNSLIHYFYAVYNGKEYDNLEHNFLFFNSERRIPSNILPIADDPFGNMVCIAVSGYDYGKVYFWDHELEGRSASYDNMSLVSNSFKEFVDSLYDVQQI